MHECIDKELTLFFLFAFRSILRQLAQSSRVIALAACENDAINNSTTTYTSNALLTAP